MNPRDVRGVLRWYPAAWRRQYGEELVAMLDDTNGDDKLPGVSGYHCFDRA